MSICTTCYQALTIPKCAEQLIVGDTLLADLTLLRVYFKVLATGYIGYVLGYVDGNEIVTGRVEDDVFTPDPLVLPQGTFIELWVTLDDINLYNTRLDIIEGEVTFTCVNFKVQAIEGEFTTVDLRPEE